MDSRAMCRDLIGSLDRRLLSFYYQIPAFSTCTRGNGMLCRRGVHRPAGGPHRGQECVSERGLSVENMRPSSAARQVLTDWASNRLPHYADAERSAVRTVREEVLRRIVREGHTVGVHSFSHDYKEIYSSPAALLDDIERCNDVIERITGRRSKVYRFPGGSFTLSAALTDAVHGAGYTYVDWNASVRDAEMPGASPADLLNAAKSTSAGRNKVVLLCHDGAGKRATADALKDIIAFYRAGGYKFCTVK